MSRSRAMAAEAMRSILYDDAPVETPEQSNALATLESEKLDFMPLTRNLVGRPGLDPGTLGIEPDHPTASVIVRITWSESSLVPSSSTETLSNLIPWLHHWLHIVGKAVSGDVNPTKPN
jgi:hypothetical protein